MVPAFIAAIIVAGSCYYDKSELLYPGSTTEVDCSIINAKFSANVLPLITSKCAIPTCHDAASGRVTLISYDQIFAQKDRIYARAVVEKTMPLSGPLLPAESNILKCWINNGAPND